MNVRTQTVSIASAGLSRPSGYRSVRGARGRPGPLSRSAPGGRHSRRPILFGHKSVPLLVITQVGQIFLGKL
jgi:hypothetical protein